MKPIREKDHGIHPDDIDEDAAKVLRRLNQFGYHAYLVGGGVRDLLLGRIPKDFDVATSARPNEVRRLFRNCRLIGRRFRLAHILFSNRKVIETATFRARPPEAGGKGALITDDNEFGTPESDAYRRDFTINALFYDPATEEVIDYCGGLADLKARTLRTIGDPVVRFREDPIRILRAIKFAARLDFEIEKGTHAAILSERGHLKKAAVPRLLEEILRMLRGGAARASFQMMAELEILILLLPEIAACQGQPVDDPCAPLYDMLAALDACEDRAEKDNGVLLAALFWPLYRAVLDDLPRRPAQRHLRPLAESLVAPAAVRLRIPRRDVSTLVNVLIGQLRYEMVTRRGSGHKAFAHSAHFPSVVDFFELRAAAESLPQEQLAELRELAEHAPTPDEDRPRRRRRGRRRRGRSNGDRSNRDRR